nr:MAG TPA_asm: hypothetical protein [Caudoviricetes sp.]
MRGRDFFIYSVYFICLFACLFLFFDVDFILLL